MDVSLFLFVIIFELTKQFLLVIHHILDKNKTSVLAAWFSANISSPSTASLQTCTPRVTLIPINVINSSRVLSAPAVLLLLLVGVGWVGVWVAGR